MVLEEGKVADDRSFVEYVQMHRDNKAPSLWSAALVACLVHAELINFPLSFRRWLIENNHTVLGYLPVCSTIEKEVTGVLSGA